MDLDSLSTQFVASLPLYGDFCTNTEYYEMWQGGYMGVPSSIIAPHVGMTIPGGQRLDAYGNNLTCVTMAGDGWRKQHTEFEDEIEACCTRYGMRCETEIYGLFAAYIAQGSVYDQWSQRKRQGLVPDFMLWCADNRTVLMELKTIHQSKTNYPNRAIRTRCGALERRASKIHGEYHTKARKIDIRANGLDPEDGGMGPCQTHLNEYGKIWGLVIGPSGSGSEDVHKLITAIAENGAERKWQVMGARSQKEARGVIKGEIRRRLGITAARAAARLKISRIGIARGDGEAASKRRKTGRDARRNVAEEWYYRYGPKAHVGGQRNGC